MPFGDRTVRCAAGPVPERRRPAGRRTGGARPSAGSPQERPGGSAETVMSVGRLRGRPSLPPSRTLGRRLLGPRGSRGVGDQGLLQCIRDGGGEAGSGSLDCGGRRRVDSPVGRVSLDIAGRVARPRREPYSKGSDVTACELVGRELVLQAVELLGGERGVGGPQAGVASERQLQEFRSCIAVQGGGDVDEVARQRAASSAVVFDPTASSRCRTGPTSSRTASCARQSRPRSS